jgi:hypothetical protein
MAFYNLGKNCIFDFKYFSSTDEVFMASSSMLEANETMREFFGLDQSRMVL